MPKPNVIFFPVKDNQSKLTLITETIQKHFVLKQPVLISVPSFEAAQYVDQLLWKMPEESFIPHVITDFPSKEFIVITTKPENLNKAKILFNLCPRINPTFKDFEVVYELMDETHPSKLELSIQRQKDYQLHA